MPLNFIKIPHLSAPDIFENISYIDLGKSKNRNEYTSSFNWGSGKYNNICKITGSNIAIKRFKSDIEFLAKYDLDLENVIFP